MTEERCVVDVLGVPYSVNITPEADDPKLESMDGYTDSSIKRIVISDVHRRPEDPENVQDQDWFQRNIIRHELIHAFMFEAGLAENWAHRDYGQEETTVDWLAHLFPKMLSAFQQADAL